MMARNVALSVLLAGLVAACGGDDDDDVVRYDAAPTPDAPGTPDATPSDAGAAVLPETLPDPLPSGGIDVTVATYNLGLIETIAWAEARVPVVTEAVRTLDAEVVCLQEVWLEYTSQPEFAASLASEFPYSFWSWTGETVFGNGVLILSKHPLYRGRELFFEGDGNAVDRIALAVDVVTDDSYFHFFCTHFEAFNDTILTSEVDRVADWIVDLGYQDDTALLLGDFNTGPFTGCFYGTCDDVENLDPYNTILETWDDAATGKAAADQCTYCREFSDPMQVIPETMQKHDQRIDGCMSRNLGTSTATDVQVIFDGVVSYEAGGETRMTQRSDHRGVRCVFGAP